MSTWVDFKSVKAAVPIQAALDHYGINWLRKKNDELRGRCPIHKGDGEDAFHVSLVKNAFHCFSCKARGNVLDFVAAMESCSVRDAAIKLSMWFESSAGGAEPSAAKKSTTADANTVSDKITERGVELSNKPLTFQLRGIDPSHAYLQTRGVMPATAQLFGAGFFPGKGSMSGRVVFPIHNEQGELIAYAGRSIDGSEPKYKLPPGFHKVLVLYNLHRVLEQGSEHIVLVEGFFDCLAVWNSGCLNVGALMGCTLSEQQQGLLVKNFQRVTLLLDGDAAGREASQKITEQLLSKLWVRVVAVPEGKQPDQLSGAEITELLKNKTTG